MSAVPEIWNQNKAINQNKDTYWPKCVSALSVCVPGSNLYIHIQRYKQSVVQWHIHRQKLCHMKYFNYLIKVIINIVQKYEIQK